MALRLLCSPVNHPPPKKNKPDKVLPSSDSIVPGKGRDSAEANGRILVTVSSLPGGCQDHPHSPWSFECPGPQSTGSPHIHF